MTLRKLVTELYYSDKNPINSRCNSPELYLRDNLGRYARWRSSFSELEWSAEFNQEENTYEDLRKGNPDMIHEKFEAEIPSVQGMRVVVDQHNYLGNRVYTRHGKLGFAAIFLEYLEGTSEEDIKFVRDYILRIGLRSDKDRRDAA